MMGYICTEGLQAREPAATKENEHIKRSLHKIIKLHFDWKLRTVKAWTKVMICAQIVGIKVYNKVIPEVMSQLGPN